ncbi:MAG TPA: SagB/ThcOx family dehydrogenase [Methylomirabilota bacterium]|nr:SagB/ThcOx family dehydrogenase [Methylomirabilota bacterium]
MESRNQQIGSARDYHDRTAHSPRSVRASGHRLDWDIKPMPFKIYPELPALPLPREFPPPALDTLAVLSGHPAADEPLDLERLAALLFFSAGVTKTLTYPSGVEVHFRAAPSTGALYQTEVYVVAGDIAGLPGGLYHFCPGDFTLRRLRDGDYRGAVALAAADESLAARPATLILSAIYWRNTWKYQARGYRHLFWDSGTLLSHLLATATALGLSARLLAGFVDAEVNALLGLDAASEGALALVGVGGHARPAPPPPVTSSLDAAVVPLSSSVVDYPLLVQAYADSTLEGEAEVLDWRERSVGRERRPAPPPPLTALPPPRSLASRTLGETIQARGSTREFSGEPISAEQLSTALFHGAGDVPADGPSALVDAYLTIHAVEGLAPGAYVYHRAPHALEPLKLGDFRADSAFLCLDQPLGGASSATVFFLADLEGLLPPLGNRGYRLVNLEAGIFGGRLYLAAYAQRFGASGLTFYDAEVVRFFSPHAQGKAAIFVTALGRSVSHAPRVAGPLTIGRASR